MKSCCRRLMLLGLLLGCCHGLAGAAGAAGDLKAWPIFYYASDPVTSETRTELLWPFYVRQATAAYTANQVLSFPQRYPDRYPNQFYLFWPLSGIRTGNGHDIWFFPFLWSGDDYFALFPAFYYSHEGAERTLNIALLQHNQWDLNHRLHALWPLFWFNHSASETGYSTANGLLPLFWYAQSQNETKTSRSDSSSGGALLLSWWYRNDNEYVSQGAKSVHTGSGEGLFPLYYRSAYDRVTERQAEMHRRKLGLFPYWQSSWSNTDTAGVTPVTEAKSFHTFFPLWWDWSGQRHQTVASGHLLFPVWWSSARTESGEVAESARFLVPVGAHLYKKGEYETQNLLGPVFNRTANERKAYVRYDAFFPFFSMTNGATHSGGRLFPFAGWGSERGKYANLWYFFPLGWDCESQEDQEYRVDTPQHWALHELESKPFVNQSDCTAGPRRTVAFYPFAWSQRRADRQHTGALPLCWWETWRCRDTVSTDTWLPLLLGRYETSRRDGRQTFGQQEYLLSLLAWGKGEEYLLRRFFPLFSYTQYSGSHHISSLLLPFDYRTWHDRIDLKRHSSTLSIPFAFLPLYRSQTNQNGADSATRKSWFFPFYKRLAEQSPERDVKKLSILWPLWNGEWESGETRIRGLGGLTNYYEKDVNGFVEQRILYRLFTRRSLSWFSDYELMPFYARQSRENGDSYWKFLGGLIGAETRGDKSYFRLLYLPIPTGRVTPPDAAALAQQQTAHADLALNYLRHGRYDRAAIEFILAGTTRDDDREFQLAAAEAYLNARPDAFGRELRSSVPSSLALVGGKLGGRDTGTVKKNLRTLAIQYFEAAIRLGADKPDALRKIARACQDLEQDDVALQKLEESDRLRPAFSTGMERLDLATRRWHSSADKKDKAETFRQVALVLLAELQKRYPDSPTLILREATLVGGDLDHFQTYAHGCVIFPENVTTPVGMQCLALCERGAVLPAGPEEKAWLAEKPGTYVWGEWGNNWLQVISAHPNMICAQNAISNLNIQIDQLIDGKKITEAEVLLPRLRKLLPPACEDCADPGKSFGAFRKRSENDISATMHNLCRLYLYGKNDPLAYIALAKEWAATLCPHQQKAVKAALEAVRFEQQYLKTWRLTPVAGCQFAAMTWNGTFFERYVNLDAILGRPDDCTVMAECVIVSPEERPAVLRLGFDHRLSAELNGATVFREKSRKIAVRDEFTVPVTLKKGENRLKLTVADDRLAFGFFARLSAPDGSYMEDVTCRSGL